MKKIIVPALTIVMMFAFAACGKNEDANELNIAYFDNITHGQALIMKHDNTLQEALGEELDVNWVAFNAGPAEVEACLRGY